MDIEEKITSIEVNMAQLTAIHTEHHKMYRDWNENIMEWKKETKETLYGVNNAPGLKTKVDRQEQLEKRRTWNIRLLWVTIVGAITKILTGE